MHNFLNSSIKTSTRFTNIDLFTIITTNFIHSTFMILVDIIVYFIIQQENVIIQTLRLLKQLMKQGVLLN